MMLAPACTATLATMSFNSLSSSPPKRPRLSLKVVTPSTTTLGKSTTALKADIDPTSPTAFNTLSNAYAIAIENASPRTAKPPNLEIKSTKPTSLRLETKSFQDGYVHPSQRTQTPGPFSVTYPDTPSSAFPSLAPTLAHPERVQASKSTANSFTFTPPQSAGSDRPVPQVFTFAANDGSGDTISTPRTPRRRMTVGSQYQVAPYTHPRSLHSILRNSPLPPRTSATPATPSRMSMRLANRAAKKVGYNDPLTQTITTNKYIKSHIDLLAEESPYSAKEADAEIGSFDTTMAYTGDETRDGGQTPGPFEEMRRRMAESDLATPGTKKRKRKEKKRKWEWTISSTEGTTEEQQEPLGFGRTPVTAFQLEPLTAITQASSQS